MSQIITVTFAEGQREAIAAQPLEQWAYGQTLQFEGLELPQAYRVDFSNFEYCGASIPRVGGPDGVAVPVEVLTSGRNVYAFIWIQDETSGARYRRATVRVVPGPEPDTDESPEEQSAVTEAINALNAAVEAIPEQVNAAVEEAVSSGTFADVFWITQNVTTADEIYAANLAGKVCLMKPAPGVLYYLTWCGEVQNLGPSGVVLEKQAILTAWDGDEKTTIRVLHETWLSPNTVKFARIASPTFTGAPKAPTAEAGTNSTQIASTAFVNAAIQAALEGFTPGQTISEELKQALLQLAEKVAYIDDQGSDYYQDLYDALYPPKELVSISAVFNQGQTVVYDTASLDSLKAMLVVTGTYDDQSTETIPSTGYTLSGTLTPGTSTITVACDGKTTTFTVQVTHQPGVYAVTNNLTGCSNSNTAVSVTEGGSYSGTITASAGYMMTGATVSITMGGTDITSTAYSNGTISIASVTGALVITVTAVAVTLSSISAVYTQSGTVYTHDTLDSLKADLVVTATYSDSSTQTVPAADYTLSGTLTAGTSTITVSFDGKTTTFSVTVTAGVPTTYTKYDYIQGTVAVTIPQAALIKLKSYTSLSSLSTEFFYKKLASGNNGVCIFGRRDGTGNTKSYAFYTGSNELGYHLHGNDSNPKPAAADDVVHKVVYANTAASPSRLSVDDGTPVSVVWVNSNVLNLAPTILTNAFNESSDSGINDGTQVGNIKFFDLSGNLVGDYFPAVRNADNVIGMFDAVEQTFYTSSTSTYCTIGNSNCKYTVGNWS